MVHFQARGLLIFAEVTGALNQGVDGGKDPEHAEQPTLQQEASQLDCQPKHTPDLDRGVA